MSIAEVVSMLGLKAISWEALLSFSHPDIEAPPSSFDDVASSYHVLTPRKKNPDRTRKTVKERSARRKPEIQKYLNYLESVQENLNEWDRRREEGEKEKRRKSSSNSIAPLEASRSPKSSTQILTSPTKATSPVTTSSGSASKLKAASVVNSAEATSAPTATKSRSKSKTKTPTPKRSTSSSPGPSLPFSFDDLKSAFDQRNVDKFLEGLFGMWKDNRTENELSNTNFAEEKRGKVVRRSDPRIRSSSTGRTTPKKPTLRASESHEDIIGSSRWVAADERLDAPLSRTSLRKLHRSKVPSDKATQVDFCHIHGKLVDAEGSGKTAREGKRKLGLVASSLANLIMAE